MSHKLIYLYLMVLIAVLPISLNITCTKNDNSNPTEPSDSENKENSEIIDESGGIIEITDPQSPIYGTKLDIPAGALSKETKISVTPSSEEIFVPPSTFSVSSFNIQFEPSGIKFNKLVTVEYPINHTTAGIDSVFIGLYDSEKGTWDFPCIIGKDVENKKLIFLTSHFSTGAVLTSMNNNTHIRCYPEEFNISSQNTQKDEDRLNWDVFPIINPPTQWWAQLLGPNAHCVPVTLFTKWYFLNRKDELGPLALNFSDDTSLEYVEYIGSDVYIQNLMNGIDEKIKIALHSHVNSITFYALKTALANTGQPQLLGMRSSDNNSAHSVLVYEIFEQADGKYSIYFFDPNSIHFANSIKFENGNFSEYTITDPNNIEHSMIYYFYTDPIYDVDILEIFNKIHAITTPKKPEGPNSGLMNESIRFSTGGSTCTKNESEFEYRFSWGKTDKPSDADIYSQWGQSVQNIQITEPGEYYIRAYSRCKKSTHVISRNSLNKKITITAQPQPIIEINAEHLSFHDVRIGETAKKSFRIYNKGSASLEITNIEIFDSQFKVHPSTPVSIAGGAYKDFDVLFSPTVEARQAGFIDIHNNSLTSLKQIYIEATALPAYYIEVISPNGGESWQESMSHDITWESNVSGGNVDIYLKKGGNTYRRVAQNIRNDGSYRWYIGPTSYAEGSDYQIQLLMADDHTIEDQSDNYFTIRSNNSINVTSPNGGEKWALGSRKMITWDSDIGGHVKITLWKESSFYTITGKTENDGVYEWDIPQNYTEYNGYKIKITSLSNSSVYGISNNYFSLSSEPYIAIIIPNGGESWQLGSSHTISWDSNVNGDVKIELYKASTSYRIIDTNTSNDGTFNWTIPTNYDVYSSYKIKITSISNSSVNGNSNGYFELRESQTGTVTDIDGNVYETIKIGDQWWMAENLKVTRYRNGDAIPYVSDWLQWRDLSTDARCAFENSENNANIYGYLYNWYAVKDSRNIAPSGWRIPTDEDWKQLEMHLGMSQSQVDDNQWRGTNEGSKLAGNASLWKSSRVTSDPEFGTSGFSALPGGYREDLNAQFVDLGSYAYFWTSTSSKTYEAWNRGIRNIFLSVLRTDIHKRTGCSVRCVRE